MYQKQHISVGPRVSCHVGCAHVIEPGGGGHGKQEISYGVPVTGARRHREDRSDEAIHVWAHRRLDRFAALAMTEGRQNASRKIRNARRPICVIGRASPNPHNGVDVMDAGGGLLGGKITLVKPLDGKGEILGLR